MAELRLFDDPIEFERVVRPLLAIDRGRSTIISTVLDGLIHRAYPTEPVLAAALVGTRPAAVAMQTPPHPVSVLADPDDPSRAPLLAGLAGLLVGRDVAAQVITGPRSDAEIFGSAWSATTGAIVEPYTSTLLYRLGDLADPVGVPGSARTADVDTDLTLLATWFHEFLLSTGHLPIPEGPDPDMIRRRAESGAAVILWEDAGRPVAMAGHTVVVDRMARIGPVYTPETLRGKGYGSAATEAAVRSAWAAGATEVVLFTDADYPTSNAIYRRLGFVEIGPFVELEVRPIASAQPSVAGNE